MVNLNKALLMGNLTRDAELRYIGTGTAILEFRVAAGKKYRRANGEEVDDSVFIDCTLWGKRAESISRYLVKGKPVFVEGRLQLDEWDDRNSGEKRFKLRVVAENIEFMGGGNRSPQGGDGAQAQAQDGARRARRQAGGDSYAPPSRPEPPPMAMTEDDIPF